MATGFEDTRSLGYDFHNGHNVFMAAVCPRSETMAVEGMNSAGQSSINALNEEMHGQVRNLYCFFWDVLVTEDI